MATPSLIPHIGFFGRQTGTVASVDEVTAGSAGPYLKGHIIHAGGLPIPFTASIDGGESFQIGTYRFYFKHWAKLK